MGKMLNTPQRFAVEGTGTFGLAALAGRSADGKTVQVFISNYAIPSSVLSAPHSAPDTSKERFLAPCAGIVYRDNAGYNLVVGNLP
jgi:hypothetical protein